MNKPSRTAGSDGYLLVVTRIFTSLGLATRAPQWVWGWFRIAVLCGVWGLSSGVASGADNFPREWFWGDDKQRVLQDELVGTRAPRLQLSHWVNPKTHGPVNLKGKIVVVDFWATWCGPCIGGIPHNNDLYAKYYDQGVEVIGVCGSEHGQEKMDEMIRRHNISYPTARDATFRSAKEWRVMWWPTYGVIDRNGVLRALGLKPGYVENVVATILAEQPPKGHSRDHSKADPRPTIPSTTPDQVVKAPRVPGRWLEGDSEKRRRLDDLHGAMKPPRLQIKNWINSQPIELSDLKGRVVVLDFWATWCGPCIDSIPKMNQLSDQYKKQGLTVIGVCAARGGENAEQIIREQRIRYPVGIDLRGYTGKDYKVDGYPDYYLIDRQGRLRIADCSNQSLEEAIKLLLNEKP